MDKEIKVVLLGKNIAKLRKLKGFTQTGLAKTLNISRIHLSKVETAKRRISLGLLFKISETLNIKEKDFFEF